MLLILKKYKLIFLLLIVIGFIIFIDNYYYLNKYKNIWWEQWKELVQEAYIDKWKIYINIRDFDFIKGQEKYFLEEYDIKKIKNIKYWYITLNLKKIKFVHNYFVLEFSDDKSFIFSIETRKHKWEVINLKNSLFNRYEIIKIFSTENDLYSYIKKNNYKFEEFKLNFDDNSKKNFLIKIIKIDLNWKKYNLIYRNCFNLSLNLIKNSFDKYIFKQIYYYNNLEEVKNLF
jgi:hypothetical protein